MNNNKKYTDLHLERVVLSQFIRKFCRLFRRQVIKELFTKDIFIEIFEFVYDGNFPPSDDPDEWWKLWRADLSLKGKEPELREKTLRLLWTVNLEDSKRFEYYLTSLKGFAQIREVYSTLEGVVALCREGSAIKAVETLNEGVKKITRKYSYDVLQQIDYISDAVERFEQMEEAESKEQIRIPTGIKKLDLQIGGGVVIPSLSFVYGETNVGKSFLLQEIAYGGFVGGENVVYITVELSASNIAMRLDSRIGNIEYSKIEKGILSNNERELLEERISNLKNRNGNLAVSFIPEGCNIDAVQAVIEYWEDIWGGVVRLVVIDHADLMESTRKSFSEQESHGNIYRDLKRYSHLNNKAIWTAAHTPKASYGKERMEKGDVGYSMKKIQISNLAIGIASGLTDLVERFIRLTVVKNSYYGIPESSILLFPDFSRGILDIGDDGEA